MSDNDRNVYHNCVIGAAPNPAMPEPDEIDAEFALAANEVLATTAALIRDIVGCHQSAAAIVVQRDWSSVRKHFSLSPKYAQWADYSTPATGYGSHDWLLGQTGTVRFTQAELEAHPAWKNFGNEAGKHPPMRGWLATPIRDAQGTTWGLLQASDKYEGEFTEADEERFTRLASLVLTTLGALWDVRNARKERAGS
jgi:GAF domain-containing protein